MIITKETDRPALKLERWAKFTETKWVIILPKLIPDNYPLYGNAGNWYADVEDAEEFDSIDDAKEHLSEYCDGAVVAFVETDHTIHY